MAKYVDVEKVFCADCEDRDRCGSPDVFCDVHSMPAADVTPVVRGRWMRRVFGYDCSQCGAIGYPSWKRCPVCEAKMNLE